MPWPHVGAALLLLSTPALAPDTPSGPPVPPEGSAAADRCPPGRVRSFAVELKERSPAVVFRVPEGRSFVLTDLVALHVGTTDALVVVRAGDEVRAVLPSVATVGQTDAYGLHFAAGLAFESGEEIVLEAEGRGKTWVTLAGIEH